MQNIHTIQQSAFNQKITVLLNKYPVILQLLRFLAIGFLNTGLSFILANLVSKYFGVSQGNGLGLSSGVGFVFATVQSYYWNKNWAFGSQESNFFKNLLKLFWVGFIGVASLGLVYLGSKSAAPFYYYLGLLLIFIVAEAVLWFLFKLSSQTSSAKNKFAQFLIISVIGFFINFIIAAKFSTVVHLFSNSDLNKNLALVVATAVSLIWNFVGYKIFVFKK